jgi:hypothetical protein
MLDIFANMRLSTAAKEYAWVNARQIWSVGTASLATGKCTSRHTCNEGDIVLPVPRPRGRGESELRKDDHCAGPAAEPGGTYRARKGA